MTVAERVSAKLRPYPAYKDSGVPWIRELPVEWEVRRGSAFFSNSTRRALPNSKQLAATQKYGVIPQDDFMNEEGVRVVLALNGTDNFKLVEPGDFVISLRSFQGGIEVSRHTGSITPAYTVLKPRMPFHTDFFAYLMKSQGFISSLETSTTGIREGRSIRYKDFAPLQMPVPPTPEQQAIAAFLDRETTRIDELVREQEALLRDLGEKRQATITQAVTAGHTPEAQNTVDLPWTQSIPASWRVVRIKHILRAFEQGWSPEGEAREATENEWAVLKSGCVNRGIFRPEEHKALSSDLTPRPELEVKEGDLLMSRASGSLDLIGSVAMVGSVRKQLMLSDKLFRLVPRTEQVSPRFLYHVMNSAYMRLQIRQVVSGAEGLANNIGKGNISNFLLLLPPAQEQQAIAAYLDVHLGQIDALVQEVRASIEDMRLHRSALITAAVTGKIDVRHLEHA